MNAIKLLRLNVGERLRNAALSPIHSQLAIAAFLTLVVQDANATPQYARGTGMGCVDCHSIPPKLNLRGESFLARGYRLGRDRELTDTLPLALWITGRYEDHSPGDLDKLYLPKVELISGGPIGDLFSCFVEWRVVSLGLKDDGTLQDRGGRFEDAFVNWEINDRHTLMPEWSEEIRPGLGFRVEHVTNAGREPAFIPYFALSAPNSKYTFLLQAEGKFQGRSKGFFLDLSILF